MHVCVHINSNSCVSEIRVIMRKKERYRKKRMGKKIYKKLSGWKKRFRYSQRVRERKTERKKERARGWEDEKVKLVKWTNDKNVSIREPVKR